MAQLHFIIVKFEQIGYEPIVKIPYVHMYRYNIYVQFVAWFFAAH